MNKMNEKQNEWKTKGIKKKKIYKKNLFVKKRNLFTKHTHILY